MATLTSPTLSRLIREVRLVLRQQNSKNSNWSDEELTVYLNDGIRRYFLEIQERVEGQFDKVVDLDIVANVETVALPSDFFSIRALFKKQNQMYEILVYRNNITASYDLQPNISAPVYAPYYYFRENNVVLRPIPGFSEVAGLKLEYTAFPETLIWGGDTLTSRISPIFKELIVMYAVYKAKVSADLNNGGDTSQKAEAHLSKLEYQFKETVGDRSKYPQFTEPFNPSGGSY